MIKNMNGYLDGNTVVKRPLILFDGVCNLCTASVQFIIANDHKEQFLFASLQSEFGQTILSHFDLPTTSFDSVILIENNKLYTQSTAALHIARKLTPKFAWLYYFIWLPRPIRDFFYSSIARNRYRFFGEATHCWLPTPELLSRFL